MLTNTDEEPRVAIVLAREPTCSSIIC